MEQVRAFIVEDDEVSAQILQRILCVGGHSVVGIVSSGEEALVSLAAADPDIIFMDISLAGELDGIETARQISARVEIPILFVTASSDDDTVLRARFSEPVGYVIKPYTDRDIFAAITIAMHKHKVDQELRETKKFFSAVIDALPAYVCVLDENGVVLTTNQTWRENAGVSPLGTIGLKEKDHFLSLLDSIIDPAYPQTAQFAQGLVSLLENRQSEFSLEYPCPFQGGQAWFHGKVSRFRGEGPLRLVVSHDNITQRRRAEQALQENEEKFRSFFNRSSDSLILVDEKGIIVEWNPAAEKLTGFSRENVLGKRYFDIHLSLMPVAKRTPQMAQRAEQEFERAFQTGQAPFLNRYLEIPFSQPDGTVVQFQQVVFPIPTEHGFKLGSNTRDISQLKKMEQAEREQRLLAENLSSSAAVINSSLKLKDVLDHILSNVGKVVPHEGADIMMLDLSIQAARTMRAHFGLALPESTILANRLLPLADFPLLCKMAAEHTALVISDVRCSPQWIKDPLMNAVCSYVAAPICAHGKVLGFINLFSTLPGFFTETHARWLNSFANQAATAVENARLYAQVERLAEVDELTSLFNRRGLVALGEREVDRAFRFQRPLIAMFMDIDQFKRFNDSYTHAVGDQVLKAVASCCLSNTRKVDVVARYGGEEFVFLLPETELGEGKRIAERLREEISNLRLATPQGALGVTVSIGVAQFTPKTPDLAALINFADQAVHLAKDQGRNRVVALL